MSSSYFAPETLDSDQPDKIFNTNNFSLVASIGIHLLVLGLVLPGLTKLSDDKRANEFRDIPLIDLNPVEQLRLPNLSSPSTSGIPEIPNLPSTDSSYLPDLSSLDTNLPPLESIDPTSSLPSLPPLPSVSIYEPPLTSSSTNTIPYPPYSNSRLPSPPPVEQNQNNDSLGQTQQQSLPFDPYRDTLPLDNIRNASIDASNQIQNPRVIQNPTEVALAQQRQRRLQEEISASLQYNPTNTTQREYRNNDLTWMQQNRQYIAKEDLISINGTYPKMACINQLTGKAIGNVTVNAQGTVINSPGLTQSTGYPILDQQAARDIVAYRFPAGQAKSYRVTVNFAPNSTVCKSTTIVPPANNIETRVNPSTIPPVEIKPTPSVKPTPAVETFPTPASTKPSNPTVQPSVNPIPNNLNEDVLPGATPQPDNVIEQSPNTEASPQTINEQPATTESNNIPSPSPSLPQTQSNNIESLTPPTTQNPSSEVDPTIPPAEKR